ncbi:MAG: cobalamin biosynthesis protein CobQ [Gammaproteobacteria bacterium]|nr:MAG: cobalamin biosynthesis protein CobQ [Gammaproteobacteria bacterium]
MKIWAVANQKGGVGKTTSVVSLGGLLAGLGKKVLMVDLDPHGSLTCYFRLNPDNIEQSSYPLFLHEGSVPENLAQKMVWSTEIEGLDLIPASSALVTLERRFGVQAGMGLVISKALAQLQNQYDFVFIDTPPQLGVLLVNALAASELILIPVQTEFLALKGLERMMHTLQMIMKSQGHELKFLVIPTMYDRRTHASVESLRRLRTSYENNIWPGCILIDTKFRDASCAGVPLSKLMPSSRGVKAYRSLLKYLVEHSISSFPQVNHG